MTEIMPGIYQTQVPIPNNPLGHTNSYLVRQDSQCLLIDPGVNNEEAFTALERGLSEIGVAFTDITQIIATHSHGDHYGLTGRVKQLSQATLLLHHLARDMVQIMSANTEERAQQTEQWLRLNGVPSLDISQSQMGPPRMPRLTNPVMPDVILQGDEVISVGSWRFKVVWTPGHDAGHICLYEANQKILFSGDHVLPTITPHVSLQTQSGANPLGDFLNSLNTVRQLDANLVLPAHERVFTNLPTRVDEILKHHEERNAEILTAIKTQPKTAYEISTEITWMKDLGGARFQDLVPWDKRMAITEALAHLEALRVDSRVDKLQRDSVIYYRRT